MPSTPPQQILELAMSSFAAAFRCLQSNSQRLIVSKTWATFADEHQHSSASLAYDTSLKALPQVASLNLDLHSRQGMLRKGSDGLAREAAWYAVRHGRFDKAIEYLEAGRAIFWSQVMRVRSPFDPLRDIAPELDERLQKVAAELERGSHRDTHAEIFDNRSQMAIEAETSQLRRLNEEWDEALDEARKLEGFEDFLQPRRFVSLQAAASDCPIVVLIPNEHGTDCLIMLSTTVCHIPLSGMTTSDVYYLVSLVKMSSSQLTVLRTSVDNADRSSATTGTLRTFLLREEERVSRPAGTSTIPSDTIFKNVLKVLWVTIVRPIIQFLNLKKTDDPDKLQKLQWCSTGIFTFLPIHAAGCYEPELGVDCASNYIISSNVPTIENMLPRSSPASKATPSAELTFNMMAVVDTRRLSAARLELQKIKTRVPVSCLSQLGAPGRLTHVDTVYAGFPTASIVHFACHGRQNTSSPLSSALLLDGGELSIAKIMQQPLPNGSLAFLCACETAMRDANTPDEALSLGASLLFSGFRSVVATMWKMMDVDGPTIADTFYEELFRGPDGSSTIVSDVSKSAQALHVAVKKQRIDGIEFRRWVPFVHLGK